MSGRSEVGFWIKEKPMVTVNKRDKKCKYIFVTGGVLSGVGKGISAASMGAILKAKGFKVSIDRKSVV